MVQLHLAGIAVSTGTTIYPGTPAAGAGFDPSHGLEELCTLITMVAADEGIEVVGDIGVTSHVGDVLRRAAIPSRLAADPPDPAAVSPRAAAAAG